MYNYAQPLENKVALITGGGQGIGLGTAEEFIAQGARVVITGLDTSQLEQACTHLGPAAAGVVADVRSEQEMRTALEHVVDRFGQLDVVVANAVVGDSNPLGKITEEQFDNIFDTNVKGVLNTVQPAMALLPDDGSVVIIGSTASIKGSYGMSLYGGAKAALRSMVRAWIVETRGTGIRINVLSPGAVDTPSLRSALADAIGDEAGVQAAVDEMGEKSPLGRLLQPRDIARSIAFLASDASSAITGVELFADGGLAQA
ncbi:short-chain alcohol dehydrogenase like protein [Saccharomonospora marina XMU15]|uniref:Short-chain alcohol dehydrogenase like protein n=2 Tax=Saccharomonospora TaxID=1851 RepID=H5WXJ5_9PSEU|nr:short-chain alcohol dehydrogenase like protein [Saccharomonospora marina XMU15]